MAAFGYNRDGKQRNRQVVCGLLCAADGCPVAVEVLPGNTADPGTIAALMRLIRERFGIESLALAGDRGVLTTARILEELGPAGLDWVSALKATDLRTLLKQPKPDPNNSLQDPRAPLRPGELVPDQVSESHSPDFLRERLLVCLNPRLKAERARKRKNLLRATEEILERIADTVRRHSSSVLRKGKDAINRRVGREANPKLVEKHFTIEVSDEELRWSRKQGSIEGEGRLDGIYAVATSLGQDRLAGGEAVAASKHLARVERAFRNLKTDRLQLRPVYLYDEEHVRGQVFLCMLAYYVEWHMRRKLAPLLFEDAHREATEPRREAPVEPAQPSPDAGAKAVGKRTPKGLSVQSEPRDGAGTPEGPDAERGYIAGWGRQRVPAGVAGFAPAGERPGTAGRGPWTRRRLFPVGSQLVSGPNQVRTELGSCSAECLVAVRQQNGPEEQFVAHPGPVTVTFRECSLFNGSDVTPLCRNQPDPLGISAGETTADPTGKQAWPTRERVKTQAILTLAAG